MTLFSIPLYLGLKIFLKSLVSLIDLLLSRPLLTPLLLSSLLLSTILSNEHLVVINGVMLQISPQDLSFIDYQNSLD